MIICVLLTLLVMPLYFSIIVSGQQPDFFAGRDPAGRPLVELAQEYWQWWIGVPKNNTIDPATGLDKCIMGSDKEGRVNFLYNPYQSSGYNMKCTITSDKYIIVPLIVGECDITVGAKSLESGKIEDFWTCAKDTDEPFEHWIVTLDNEILFKSGREGTLFTSGDNGVNVNLKDEILVRNSPWFTIEIPTINRYSAPAGSYEAVVDGYYLPLKPLPPGEHVLEYVATHNPPSASALGQHNTGKVKYSFTVTD